MKLRTILLSLLTLTSLTMSGHSLAQKPAMEAPTAIQAEQVQAPTVISDKVNVNSATASELQKALVGIGAKKAEAIVQYREAHGPFTSLEQLLEVQGIGKATLEKNKDRILL